MFHEPLHTSPTYVKVLHPYTMKVLYTSTTTYFDVLDVYGTGVSQEFPMKVFCPTVVSKEFPMKLLLV